MSASVIRHVLVLPLLLHEVSSTDSDVTLVCVLTEVLFDLACLSSPIIYLVLSTSFRKTLKQQIGLKKMVATVRPAVSLVSQGRLVEPSCVADHGQLFVVVEFSHSASPDVPPAHTSSPSPSSPRHQAENMSYSLSERRCSTDMTGAPEDVSSSSGRHSVDKRKNSCDSSDRTGLEGEHTPIQTLSVKLSTERKDQEMKAPLACDPSDLERTHTSECMKSEGNFKHGFYLPAFNYDKNRTRYYSYNAWTYT